MSITHEDMQADFYGLFLGEEFFSEDIVYCKRHQVDKPVRAIVLRGGAANVLRGGTTKSVALSQATQNRTSLTIIISPSDVASISVNEDRVKVLKNTFDSILSTFIVSEVISQDKSKIKLALK